MRNHSRGRFEAMVTPASSSAAASTLPEHAPLHLAVFPGEVVKTERFHMLGSLGLFPHDCCTWQFTTNPGLHQQAVALPPHIDMGPISTPRMVTPFLACWSPSIESPKRLKHNGNPTAPLQRIQTCRATEWGQKRKCPEGSRGLIRVGQRLLLPLREPYTSPTGSAVP